MPQEHLPLDLEGVVGIFVLRNTEPQRVPEYEERLQDRGPEKVLVLGAAHRACGAVEAGSRGRQPRVDDIVERGLEAANGAVCVRRLLPAGIVPGEHGVAERVIRGTVLRGLPGGLQVRRVALDGLPQDLDRQHRLDPFRTVWRASRPMCSTHRRPEEQQPDADEREPRNHGTEHRHAAVLGTALLEIVSGITPFLEFTSPTFVLPSSMLALRSTLPAPPPPSLLSPTTRHPCPPTPVELIIGKVSLGPLGNWSFSGSTGIGTMSLSGLSLTASGTPRELRGGWAA